MKSLALRGVTQSVLPTPTTILTVRVLDCGLMTVEVKNQDGSQTLDVQVWRRCSLDGDYSLSPYDYFTGIAAGASACADLDVRGCVDVQLRATASGIGLNCRVAGLLVEAYP